MAEQVFIVGPLRTGSSLTARCLDDHPQAICLCESEVSRALFAPFATRLHFDRMEAHGLGPREIMGLLDGKLQGSVDDLLRWYGDVLPILEGRLGKHGAAVLGDKSPDLDLAPATVALVAERFRLVYTVRDPRAILRSIWRDDEPESEKLARWHSFKRNVASWMPFWDRPNLLVSRYEDLVRTPEAAMHSIYAHCGLAYSDRYMQGFERLFPRRFLWTTAIDWETGVRRQFNPARAEVSDADLGDVERSLLAGDRQVAMFRERFGY
ncbi:MAG: sulfotransferase [Erythrobacter sp.]|nr:sulfotransferase [Erythrobacter sp.]